MYCPRYKIDLPKISVEYKIISSRHNAHIVFILCNDIDKYYFILDIGNDHLAFYDRRAI